MSKPGKPRKIYEPETGRHWRSVAALSQETGWSFPTIVRHIEAGDLLDGRAFVFADDHKGAIPDALMITKLRAENFRLRRLLAARRK